MPKLGAAVAPVPEPAPPPTKIRPILGDSMELIPRWPDGCIDILCSDPPYGIPVIWEGTAGWHIGDSDMDATVALVEWIVRESARIVVDTGYLYLTAGISIYPHAVLAAQKAGWKIRPWVWIKPNPRPLGKGFPWKNNHELVVFGYRKQGGRDYKGGVAAHYKHDEVQEADAYYEGAPPLGKMRIHPNQKPVGLFETWLRQTPGRVLDPFMGSGPALIAAQRLGLDAVGIENDPKWYDLATMRLETDAERHWT
jgi:DNA modification methylase